MILKPTKPPVSLALSLLEGPPLVVGIPGPIIEGHTVSGDSARTKIRTTTGHDAEGVGAWVP